MPCEDPDGVGAVWTRDLLVVETGTDDAEVVSLVDFSNLEFRKVGLWSDGKGARINV